MIELLLIILLAAEIALSVFLILKMQALKNKIINTNLQINNIKEISGNIRKTASKIQNGVTFFIQFQKDKEISENIKFAINIIFAAITFLRGRERKLKTKHK